MLLSEYTTAIKNTIRHTLPQLRQCDTHSGEITAQNLLKMGTRAPAVYVTLAQIHPSDKTPAGHTIFPLVPVVYVVTTDTRNLPRFEAAVNLVQTLLLCLDGNVFGLECVGLPDMLTSKNLFNGEIEKEKLCLWAISWRQEFYADDLTDDNDGVLPAELYIGIAPDIGPDNLDKYEHVPLAQEDA